MSRRRAMNPAKVKADLSALEQEPPAEIFRGRLELRRRLSVALLAVLTVVLLTVCFTPFDCWYLAYVALVPWALALGGATQRRWALLWGWLAGLIFWAANLYWLWWITLVGYAALVIYLSAYWLAAAIVVRAAMRRRLPMWIVLPIVWVCLEYARAYVISGFPWLFLAHSQYAQTRLIQITDVTGQYGVSFFVAMINGTLIDLLSAPLFARREGRTRLSRQLLVAPITAVVATAFLLGYGTWRLAQRTQAEGPVLGIVQQAFRVSLMGRDEPAEKIYHSHYDNSATFIGAGCDLVIWPETMLPGPGMNPELLEADPERMDFEELRSLAGNFVAVELASQQTSRTLRYYLAGWIRDGIEQEDGTRSVSLREYAEQMATLSRRLGCPILAGAPTLHRDPSPLRPADRWVRRNSVLCFDGTWRTSDLYSKVHLVPFGEYVPFKRSWPWLHLTLRRFVPEVMPQLDPGRRFTRFELVRGQRRWRLAVPICYEGTFARVCRKMVMDDGKKLVNILVNISNDGWFVWRWSDGTYHGSTEHPQHLVQYCFRAVESRVPVVRAVNTGISASIDSNGRIVADIHHRGKRRMVAGTLLLDHERPDQPLRWSVRGPKVLVDARVSLYSLVGDVFAITVSLAAGGLLLWLVIRRPRTHGKAKR